MLLFCPFITFFCSAYANLHDINPEINVRAGSRRMCFRIWPRTLFLPQMTWINRVQQWIELCIFTFDRNQNAPFPHVSRGRSEIEWNKVSSVSLLFIFSLEMQMHFVRDSTMLRCCMEISCYRPMGRSMISSLWKYRERAEADNNLCTDWYNYNERHKHAVYSNVQQIIGWLYG